MCQRFLRGSNVVPTAVGISGVAPLTPGHRRRILPLSSGYHVFGALVSGIQDVIPSEARNLGPDEPRAKPKRDSSIG
jgi:hypothetical protein